MRLYHFLNEYYGLDDIKRRRLKISTFDELNDPFELISIDFSNESIRRAFNALKGELSKTRGIICFSNAWKSPLLWGHYADKHRGICLGFDIPDNINKIKKINYSSKRIAAELDKLEYPDHELSLQYMEKLLFTKYSHWRYENEYRAFATLDEVDAVTGLYFADFSDDLMLREVIIGANCNISRETIKDALGDLNSSVKVTKTRLAFKSFKVVTQRNNQLWK